MGNKLTLLDASKKMQIASRHSNLELDYSPSFESRIKIDTAKTASAVDIILALVDAT